MKNKLLTIAITAALTSLSTGAVMADGNSMNVTQKDSAGTINATQGGTIDGDATSNSTIMIHQEGAADDTAITIQQIGASGVHADVVQYQNESEAASTITINQSGGLATAGNHAYISQGGMMDTDGNFSAGTNVGNTFVVNHQNGSGNTIAGYGSAWTEVMPEEEGGEVMQTLLKAGHASQTGASNTATLNQDGTGNLMGFSQNGTQNTATLTQSMGSSESSLNLMQDGLGNSTMVQQGGDGTTDSHINISIEGDENDLGSDDYSVSQLSSNSNVGIAITGNSNKANVSQAMGADDSSVMLIQDGDLNVADMAQNGFGNSMDLTQNGDNNMATLIQNGSNDMMTVTQYGGSTAMLTQH